MLFLKQSTASQSVLIGPFVDSTDGNTAETGLTISNTDIRLSKNGGNMAAKNSGGGTHDELGYYTITLDATDTNTVGRLQLCVHESGALPVWHEYQVLEEAVYDDLMASAAAGYAGVSELATVDSNVDAILVDTGTTLDGKIDTVDTNVDSILVDTGTTLQAELDAIQAATITNAAGADIAADIIAIKAETASILTDTGTTLDGKLDTIDTNVDSVLVDTAVIGALGAGLTAIPWNAAWDAEVQSEVDDALVANHLDHLLAADYDPASKPGVATALMNELVENDAGVSRFTENALEQAPSGTGASAATIADAVWDEAQGDHVGAGTFGITASEIADILTDTGTTLDGKLDTIDSNVDAVLVDTGTTLQAELDAIQAATITNAAGADIAADIIAVKAETASILTDTGTTLDGKINTIDTNVDAILVDTGTTLQAELDGIQTDTENIQSRLPAALVSGRMSSDAVSISGSTAAADNLEASAEVIVVGAAEAGTLSTTAMTTDLTEATDDHYNGRIIIWTSGVLIGQATDITDYAGANGLLTFTAVTEAPTAADTFVIV